MVFFSIKSYKSPLESIKMILGRHESNIIRRKIKFQRHIVNTK